MQQQISRNGLIEQPDNYSDNHLLPVGNQKSNQPEFHNCFQGNQTPPIEDQKSHGKSIRSIYRRPFTQSGSTDSGLSDIASVKSGYYPVINRSYEDGNKTLTADNQVNVLPAFHKYFQVNTTPCKSSPNSVNDTIRKFPVRRRIISPSLSESGSTDSNTVDTQNANHQNKNDANQTLSANSKQRIHPPALQKHLQVKSSLINDLFPQKTQKSADKSGSTDCDLTLKAHSSTDNQENPSPFQKVISSSTKKLESQKPQKLNIYSNKEYDEKINQKIKEKAVTQKTDNRVVCGQFHTTVSGHLGLAQTSKSHRRDNQGYSFTENIHRTTKHPSIDKQPDDINLLFKQQVADAFFDKNFKTMRQNETAVFKDDGELKVNGEKLFEQLEQWTHANLEPKLLQNVQASDNQQPTDIQKQIIPYIQNRYNVKCQSAESGSGKNASFLIPLIDNFQKDKETFPINGPVCLIISPTREQVQKIYEEAKTLAYGTGITVSFCYGKYDTVQNLADLRNGCNILCACVGRLMTFVQNGHLSISNVRYLVIDEAEKFIGSQNDSDFGILKLLNYPLFPSKEKRQTVLFSATLKDPSVQQFAVEHVDDKKLVFIGAAKNLSKT